MPRLKAQQVLDEAPYRGVQLTADQIYDLVLKATENEDKAEKAFKLRRHAELRAGITPA